MWFLLGTTLTASFFDSLNPSAIAQQMLLQAMVKKKRHIWFFICGIGTANLIMGLAIYYGIATWVSKFLTKIVNAYPLYVYGAAAIGGIVLLGAGIRLIIKTRQSNAEKNNNGFIDEAVIYDAEGKTFYPVTEGDLQIGDYSFHTYYEDGGYEIEIAYTGE